MSPLQRHMKRRQLLMTATADHSWISCLALTAVEPFNEFVSAHGSLPKIPLCLYIFLNNKTELIIVGRLKLSVKLS